MAGFLARAKWKLVSASYVIMLSAYFISPYGRTLPIWTILDILFAFFLIYPTAKVSHHLAGTDVQRLSLALVLVSFICIATDSLVRVFLLVPCGLYAPLGVSKEVFIGGAVSSYLEDGIVVLISLIAGVPVLISALKLKIIEDLSR